MYYRIFSILVTIICLFSCVLTSAAQNTSNTDGAEKPVILYSGTPKKYEIADIKVVGAKNYEDYVIIGLSGLSKGQTITVPGDEITQACKRYWRHGLFSDVQITADKIEGFNENAVVTPDFALVDHTVTLDGNTLTGVLTKNDKTLADYAANSNGVAVARPE